jgi:hypothetical protein
MIKKTAPKLGQHILNKVDAIAGDALKKIK